MSFQAINTLLRAKRAINMNGGQSGRHVRAMCCYKTN